MTVAIRLKFIRIVDKEGVIDGRGSNRGDRFFRFRPTFVLMTKLTDGSMARKLKTKHRQGKDPCAGLSGDYNGRSGGTNDDAQSDTFAAADWFSLLHVHECGYHAENAILFL